MDHNSPKIKRFEIVSVRKQQSQHLSIASECGVVHCAPVLSYRSCYICGTRKTNRNLMQLRYIGERQIKQNILIYSDSHINDPSWRIAIL